MTVYKVTHVGAHPRPLDVHVGVDHSVRRFPAFQISIFNRLPLVCFPSAPDPPLIHLGAKWGHRMCSAGAKIYDKQSLLPGKRAKTEICVSGSQVQLCVLMPTAVLNKVNDCSSLNKKVYKPHFYCKLMQTAISRHMSEKTLKMFPSPLDWRPSTWENTSTKQSYD